MKDQCQCRVGKVSCEEQSSVDSLNDRKSAGHEKGRCLEDYYWRSWHVWNATRLGVQENCCTGKTFLFSWSHSVWLFLLPKLKGTIKETRFKGVRTNKRAVTTELQGIPEEYRRIRKSNRHKGIILKKKPGCYLFRVEINSLWHQPHYLSDTSGIYKECIDYYAALDWHSFVWIEFLQRMVTVSFFTMLCAIISCIVKIIGLPSSWDESCTQESFC